MILQYVVQGERETIIPDYTSVIQSEKSNFSESPLLTSARRLLEAAAAKVLK